MKLKTIIYATAFASSTAYAQEDTTKWFRVTQECMPIQQFMESTLGRYGEQALFTGKGVTIGIDGQAYSGQVMLLVNQQSGTWTLGTLYNEDTVCINAAGTEFVPYSG